MIGFDAVESTLSSTYRSNKLHHAILLNGKKGVGKAGFAKEFCLKVLNANGESHPDLLVIEKEEGKREINVEKVRKISEFLNQTSAISQDKFIIIDSACELNKSAANALLKILEEPHANNFLILVSHNLSRVLPTIKSRCQIVKIPDLSLENFSEILRQKNIKFLPEEMKFLAEICDNSPAELVSFGEDLSRIYQLFLRSILNKKPGEEFLKKVSDKNFHFAIFEKISEFFFNRLIKISQGAKINFFFDEEKVFTNLTQEFDGKKIFTIADESMIYLRKASQIYLDKKLCVTNIFNRICYE